MYIYIYIFHVRNHICVYIWICVSTPVRADLCTYIFKCRMSPSVHQHCARVAESLPAATGAGRRCLETRHKRCMADGRDAQTSSVVMNYGNPCREREVNECRRVRFLKFMLRFLVTAFMGSPWLSEEQAAKLSMVARC